jgi:hypothetical protein
MDRLGFKRVFAEKYNTIFYATRRGLSNIIKYKPAEQVRAEK